MIRIVLVILGATLVPAAAAAAQAPDATRCKLQPAPAPAPSAAAPPKGAQPARLEEKPIRFARGGDRGPSDRTVVLASNPPLDPNAQVFAEPTGDLDKEDASDSFDEEGIVVQPSVTRSGDLRLKVCIDPQQPENVEYGRYVGTIRVSGSAVQPTAIPMEVTLRKTPVLAIFLLLLGSVVGIVAKALGDKKSANETVAAAKGTQALEFRWGHYLGSAGFIGGVLGGLVAAALAYAQVYAADPDWGTPLDMFVLAAAGAAAQVTGKTVADVVAPYVPQPAGGA